MKCWKKKGRRRAIAAKRRGMVGGTFPHFGMRFPAGAIEVKDIAHRQIAPHLFEVTYTFTGKLNVVRL